MREKLVRDRIPELIRQAGGQPVVRVASEEEMDTLLRAKVVEEARELFESGHTEEIIDLIEVLERLLRHRGISHVDLERLRREKVSERGGFERGWVLIEEDQQSR